MSLWRFLITVICLVAVSYFLLSSILVGDRKQSPETIAYEVLSDQAGQIRIALPGERFSKLALYQLAQTLCEDRSPCRLDILRRLPELDPPAGGPAAGPQSRELIARFVKVDGDERGQFNICADGVCD